MYDEEGELIGVLGVAHDITALREAELAIKEREDRLRRLGDNLPGGLVYQYALSRGQPRFHYLSAGIDAMLGISAEQAMADPLTLLSLIDPAQRTAYLTAEVASLNTLTDFAMELRMRHRKTGAWVWVSLRSRPRRLDPETVIWDGIALDITGQKRAEDRLRLAAQVFSDALEGILICDAQGNIQEVNPAFSVITGFQRGEVIGQNPRLLKSGRHGPEFYAKLWDALLATGQWQGELWNRRKNGELYAQLLTISSIRDDAGQVQHFIGLFSDITESKMQQEKLERLAHFDALTHLPNRVLLADRLRQAMSQIKRRRQHLALVYLDLDGFKEVNDRHGHEVGDRLLVLLAEQMRHSLRDGDTIARLGGDEFVAVLIDLPNRAACTPLVDRLLAAAGERVRVGELELQVSASLGVSFYPQPQEVDPDQLLRQADQAMYQAKLAGKNQFRLFDG
jgi:diguanylate cyclase (GGDEF)-like protein/PAS domain S-box-containing protein